MSRAAKILVALEDTRQVTVDDLADALGVSRRTVAAEIVAVQELLGSSASIALANGNYRLLIADPARYCALRARAEARTFNDPETRASHIVALLFQAILPVRTDELAAAMSVSRTTVIADLQRARAQVAGSGLSIEGRTNVGLALQGPELQQRLHVLRHRLDAMLPNAEISNRIGEAVSTVGSDLTREQIGEWSRWAGLAIERAAAGFPDDFMPDEYRSLADTPAYELAARLAGRLAAATGVELGKDDQLFLALPVAGFGAEADPGGEVSAEVGELVDLLLSAIRCDMEIDLNGRDFLAEFTRHIGYLLTRAQYRIWVDDLGVGDIREEYPVAYRMAALAQQVLEEHIGLPIDAAELGFLAAYFQVFLEAGERRGTRPPRVFLVSGVGAVRMELVKLQLAKFLSPDTEFITMSADQARGPALEGADLVVVFGDGEFITQAPVLHVAQALDRRAIERQLERVQLHLPMQRDRAGGGSILAAALDEHRFFAFPQNTDLWEAVDNMCHHLEAQGIAEVGFGERLRDRYRSADVLLDPWVAFPHVTLTTQTSVMLAVGVIPRAPQDDGVRIVILLGLPAASGRNEEVLVQVYGEVLRLGARRDLLESISRTTGYEQFYYLLERNPLTESRR